MLARVALEPDWREGEISDVTVLSQTVLAQSRTLLLSLGAFGAEATSSTPAETFVWRTRLGSNRRLRKR